VRASFNFRALAPIDHGSMLPLRIRTRNRRHLDARI
jgi:hypothetical protein